jgi:WD40 repeat protein
MAESSVRIFVSSPSDVEHERALVKDIIEVLGQEYLPYFKLQAVLWEEEALTAAKSFQAGLVRPSDCEIVLVMLWSRLGTPLADDPYGGMTGTEWEFVDAVDASARQGSPEVLVYKKTAPCLVDINNADAVGAAVADRERLETFFHTHFFNPDGSFRRAFRQFDSDTSFRALVETQLRKLLHRRISAERRFAAGVDAWLGSPFRADGPFDVGDTRIFTGRETETRELVARLDALGNRRQGFLLLTGASGVGKTSLIRAGLVPHLIRPFLFTEISTCRWSLVEPDPDDPIRALAAALTTPGMLGVSLAGSGLDAERLARLLTSDPAVAAEQVRAALIQAGQDELQQAGRREGRLQLALILDPLDALVVEPRLSAPQTAALITALTALAAQDGIWVIATLRSDRLTGLPRLQELTAILDEHSWFPLAPTPPARIRQVMEIPARVAGIEYEEDTKGAGRGLVETLESEISTLPHWPSLLEQTLEELYQQARGRPESAAAGRAAVLTVRDLRAIGGLSGNLVGRADALWHALDEETRAALPRLCRGLIALEGGSRARPSAREGDLQTLTRDGPCANLIQRLMVARLLITDAVSDPAYRIHCAPTEQRFRDYVGGVLRQIKDEWRARLRTRNATDPLDTLLDVPDAGTVTVSDDETDDVATTWEDYRAVTGFIHPALFERWAPVQTWLSSPDNRRDLALRHQISRQARLWKRTDCNREHLLGEVGYAAAHRFARTHERELEPLERDFLEHSWVHLRFQRRRNRLAIAATLAILTLFAGITVFSVWDAAREARLNVQSGLLREADTAIVRGNTPRALRLALAAGPDLPDIGVDTLARTLTKNRLIAMTATAQERHGHAPTFQDHGEQLVTLSPEQGTQRWQREGPEFRNEANLAGPDIQLHSIRFVSGDKTEIILGIGAKGVWRLPAKTGQPPDWFCEVPEDAVIAADPQGRYLAISHTSPPDQPAICLLDLSRPGAPLWDRKLASAAIRGLAFAPDGARLVSASRDGLAYVLDTLSGDQPLVLPRDGALGRPATRAIFSPDGRRIAVASMDESLRIYDVSGMQLAELGSMKRGKRMVRIHQSAIRDLVFSPDGQALVVGDGAGQVVRWDLRTNSAQVLGQHDLGVDRVMLSPDVDPTLGEFLVLSLSQDRSARLWTLETGRLVAVFSHDTPISDARFSRDGRFVMTSAKQDGSARLWTVAPTNPLAFRLPQEDHVQYLDMIQAPPDPALGAQAKPALLVATGDSEGHIDVWRYDRTASDLPPTKVTAFSGHRARVRRVAFSSSARSLASASADGTARVWNLQSGTACRLRVASQDKVCRSDGAADCPTVYQALIGPDEHWLLTTSSDAQQPIRIWDLDHCASLPLPEALNGVKGTVQAAAQGKDAEGGVLVAAGGEDGVVRLLRRSPAGDWDRICQWEAHQGAISEVALSRDGHWLAAASRDGRTSLFQVSAQSANASCGEPQYLDGHAGAVYGVQFTPDGKSLVTASFESKAHVWSLDGSLLAELGGHMNRVTSAQFSPDGRWIMTASRDGSLRLWQRPIRAQAEPLLPYLTLDGDLGTLTSARFSPDGHSIAAGYWDNAALLWRVWGEDSTPDPALESRWGTERARLELIRIAQHIKAKYLDRNEQRGEGSQAGTRALPEAPSSAPATR